jgi:hypothetical protein
MRFGLASPCYSMPLASCSAKAFSINHGFSASMLVYLRLLSVSTGKTGYNLMTIMLPNYYHHVMGDTDTCGSCLTL